MIVRGPHHIYSPLSVVLFGGGCDPFLVVRLPVPRSMGVCYSLDVILEFPHSCLIPHLFPIVPTVVFPCGWICYTHMIWVFPPPVDLSTFPRFPPFPFYMSG